MDLNDKSMFRIAEAEVARRERLPLVAAAIFGIVGGLIGYGKSSDLVGAVVGAAVAGGVMWFLKRREVRAFRQWAPSHSLQLGVAGVTVVDGATTSHLPYTGVRQIVVVGSDQAPQGYDGSRQRHSRGLA